MPLWLGCKMPRCDGCRMPDGPPGPDVGCPDNPPGPDAGCPMARMYIGCPDDPPGPDVGCPDVPDVYRDVPI